MIAERIIDRIRRMQYNSEIDFDEQTELMKIIAETLGVIADELIERRKYDARR